MKKALKELYDMSFDVNPNEIASHIADDTLGDWCKAFQVTMRMYCKRLENDEEDWVKFMEERGLE